MGQIYKENNILANKILEIEQHFKTEDEYFLSKFTQWIYNEKIRDRNELKKSVKLYENLKSEIDKTCKNINLESIYSQKEFNDEGIQYKLLDELVEELKKIKF
jgi:predicted phage-related endonuclease